MLGDAGHTDIIDLREGLAHFAWDVTLTLLLEAVGGLVGFKSKGSESGAGLREMRDEQG